MTEQNKKKVNILLSAYNGEKYIQEQIDSLLNQTYTNYSVYIRDDGSTDRTPQILRSYESNPRFHIIFGENKGFIDSFLTLLQGCDQADYYAFCDQDDYWMPFKVEYAVSTMEKEEQQIPALYFSAYEFANEKLEKTGTSKSPTNLSFANALMDCAPLGFTTVINDAAREIIKEKIPKKSCGHDWWVYMVCCGMGKVIYDDRVTVLYRRYSGNVSSGGASFFKFQIWRFKKFFAGNYFLNITEMLREYEELFGERISDQQLQLLQLFTHKTLTTAVTKTFYPHRFRQNGIDEISLRLCFLIGRL